MITIKEIADRAGVQVKTAQRALCGVTMGKRRDAKARAQRVLNAAAELGYHTSIIARSLRSNRIFNLSFLVNSLTNPTYAAAVEVAMDEAEKFGYDINVRVVRHNNARMLEFIQRCNSSEADGVLLVGQPPPDAKAFYAELRKRKYPLITIDSANEFGFSSASIDCSDAVATAVRHLAGQGHASVQWFQLKDSATSAACRKAFHAACRKYNVAGSEFVCPDEVDNPDDALKEAAAASTASAVIVYAKYALAGFISCRTALQLPLPALVSFFDEWSWSSAPQDLLAGVIFSGKESQIRLAVRQVFAELDHESEPRTIVLPARFVSREQFASIQFKDLKERTLFT